MRLLPTAVTSVPWLQAGEDPQELSYGRGCRTRAHALQNRGQMPAEGSDKKNLLVIAKALRLLRGAVHTVETVETRGQEAGVRHGED